ncbi:MAG: glycosyltransferase family 4 protein [Leptospiraceae bacterium]|nr:glycosyltransferase family 4 protein [Leptospiraceae bacterium]
MIGWEYPPHITGGLGIACQGMARALAEAGHTVYMLLPHLHGDEEQVDGIQLIDISASMDFLSNTDIHTLESLRHYQELLSTPFSVYSSGWEVLQDWQQKLREIQFVSTENRKNLLAGGYGDDLFFQVSCFREWVGLVARYLDFDVIHAHDWMCFGAGKAAADASGKPFIAHIHATEFDRNPLGINQGIYDLERRGFHEADSIVSVSNYTARTLMQHYGVPPEKIHVVHNGVDLAHELTHQWQDRSQRAIAPNDYIVLFLGRITFQKGPDYFVRAAAKVIERLPGVRFVMAGKGDMYQRMIEMAAEMGIGKYFHYTGFLSKAEVREAYLNSDLYILPSVSEPFGISPIEAMLHGVPVILSRQSGVSEVITHCMKVDFWNVDEIADRMISLLSDESLRANIRELAYEEAKTISWQKAAEKLGWVYETALIARG